MAITSRIPAMIHPHDVLVVVVVPVPGAIVVGVWVSAVLEGV